MKFISKGKILTLGFNLEFSSGKIVLQFFPDHLLGGMVDIPESIKYDYRFKYIVVGSPVVGKTSFIERFVYNTFEEQEKSSLPHHFYHKYIYTGKNIQT